MLLRARVSRASKRWERDQDLVLVCHQTSVSRIFPCGPIVVELTLPILAHKPDTKLRLHGRILPRLGLDALPLVCARGIGRRCILS